MHSVIIYFITHRELYYVLMPNHINSEEQANRYGRSLCDFINSKCRDSGYRHDLLHYQVVPTADVDSITSSYDAWGYNRRHVRTVAASPRSMTEIVTVGRM